jgi:hypothetical protein
MTGMAGTLEPVPLKSGNAAYTRPARRSTIRAPLLTGVVILRDKSTARVALFLSTRAGEPFDRLDWNS